MADDKMKSEDMVPQADKQAHTEMNERADRASKLALSTRKRQKRGRTGSVRQPVGEFQQPCRHQLPRTRA